MAGTNARHAARTLNTTCLARATQTINAAKITIRSRKNPAPCGSNTQISSPDAGQWGMVRPTRTGIPAHCRMITCANVRDVRLSSPGKHVERARGPRTAVEVGFEPTEGLPPHTLSRRAPSATRRLHRGRAYPNRGPGGEVLAAGPPAGGEELAQHGAALLRQDAADDFRPVVQALVPEHVPERAHRAGLRILGSVDQPAEPGQ